MKKANKKYLLKLSGVGVLLVGVVVGMLAFINYSTTKDYVKCVVAKEPIEIGYQFQATDLNTKFQLKSVHIDAIGGVAYKDQIISMDELTDWEAKYTLKPNQPILKDDLAEKGTYGSAIGGPNSDSNKTNLIKIPLTIPVNRIASGKLTIGDVVTVYGLSDISDDKSDGTTTWYGVLSQNAKVLNIVGTMETGSSVTLTIEIKSEEYNRLLQVNDRGGTIYIVNGDTDGLNDSSSNVINNMLSESKGIHNGYITFADTNIKESTINFCKEDKDGDYGFDLVWADYVPTKVIISHYSPGQSIIDSPYRGTYTLSNVVPSRNISYDNKTGLYSFYKKPGSKFMFDSPGYYEIIFIHNETSEDENGNQITTEEKKVYKFFIPEKGSDYHYDYKVGYYTSSGEFVNTGRQVYYYDSTFSSLKEDSTICDFQFTRSDLSGISYLEGVDYNDLDPNNSFILYGKYIRNGIAISQGENLKDSMFRYYWNFEENMFEDRKSISAPAKTDSVNRLIDRLVELNGITGVETELASDDIRKNIISTIKSRFNETQVLDMLSYYNNIQIDGIDDESRDFYRVGAFFALKELGYNNKSATFYDEMTYAVKCFNGDSETGVNLDEYKEFINKNYGISESSSDKNLVGALVDTYIYYDGMQ